MTRRLIIVVALGVVLAVFVRPTAAQEAPATQAEFMQTVMELLLSMERRHAEEVAELRAQVEALSNRPSDLTTGRMASSAVAVARRDVWVKTEKATTRSNVSSS